ncbi:MAG TPA: hypothetical protein PK331_06990 [Gordonia sp. (in: high G+C Gram-positive bacteria)]|uniref:hypothetical protein n=1 Tax=unclassified Gordonia (in: high G+C Gram-positive bacteria) TaxID=2657482 RepID=UPI000FB79F61|nr:MULTISPECIES: hypothetical protein [unclassified Gordonia (in: high G+C Gram-positive bacteria)]RUP39179.1 MAG: hypothetical protein EKK60_07525 [Gordonia sp. (in: high G+C Gram-positive bacteria)]HNP56495.1 hypothetical protein [Gordonia sp. (in: high G+C Gram-positive bacteria)]HRC50652.1 hypothetical protein [Gordonia sp. (in: high G+C Gram-positive bacteria)]
MLDEMQAEAKSLYVDGEYLRALAEFSVLAEIRARREGPYSPSYLRNLHDCIRCAYELARWPDCVGLCTELHGKYVRTHGRAESDTVDVAKRWAWALLNLREYRRAVAVYLQTADALWESDPVAARRLLGAPATLRAEVDPAEFAQPLRHGLDLLTTIAELENETDANPSLTVDGLAPVS